MTDRKQDTERQQREHRRRSHEDDPTRDTNRQIDDNQDDLGRDVNDPDRIANPINKEGH